MRLPDELRGHQVRCPECQEIFVAEPPADFTVEPVPSMLPRRSDGNSGPPGESAPTAWSPSRRRPLDDDDDDDDPFNDERPRRPFRPTGSLGLTVTILLLCGIALSFIMLGSGWMQY